MRDLYAEFFDTGGKYLKANVFVEEDLTLNRQDVAVLLINKKHEREINYILFGYKHKREDRESGFKGYSDL